MSRSAPSAACIESDVPARLDALPWSRFHTLVVVALGITWVLDGLEVTLAGAVSGALKASPALRLTDAEVGITASAYLAGAVSGALLFGWLADLFGRKRLFFVTLGIYIAGTALSALSPGFAFFMLSRFITGAGIGGEYAAVNSAIDELIPARFRGRADLAVNGSYWVGAALGADGSSLLLDPGFFPLDIGLARGVRHGRGARRRDPPPAPPPSREPALAAAARPAGRSGAHRGASRARGGSGRGAARSAHRGCGCGCAGVRRASSTSARASSASTAPRGPRARVDGRAGFCYNAIFFTYALVLGRFYSVPPEDVRTLPARSNRWCP